MALETYRRKRNFRTTPEPRGRVARRKSGALAFVIQKHRASHLHYDFRLELDGVLLSWAVPKGPSLDPDDRRLAMHVEDHPVEYGDFEGVIPPGQYGSGTVMLWDRGTWEPQGDVREEYRRGKLHFTLHGEKLAGEWILVQGRSARHDDDRVWFLMKVDDGEARRGEEAHIVDTQPLSVASGRDLDAIAADADRVWRPDRSVAENVKAKTVKRTRPHVAPEAIERARRSAMPETMAAQLATLAKEAPDGDAWVHEVKYDGYRMLCRVSGGRARVFSRNGKEWTANVPPIAAALARLPVKDAWLDGELVVLDAHGRTSFQALQHALGSGNTAPMSLWLFDLMHLDGYDLRAAPLEARKAALEKLVGSATGLLRYSAHFEGAGSEVLAKACKLGLEGIIAKRRDAPYQPRRTSDWLKVKCASQQEMVIGGYTDPGGSRTGFGALLLGVHDERGGSLRYCGKVGTGFDEATLRTLSRILARLEQKTAPFANPPRGYEAKGAHWVKPMLVAQIAFTEWTRNGTVRHPSFQGLREDKKAGEVVHERPAELGAIAPDGDAPVARNARQTRAGNAKAAAAKDEAPTGDASRNATKAVSARRTPAAGTSTRSSTSPGSVTDVRPRQAKSAPARQLKSAVAHDAKTDVAAAREGVAPVSTGSTTTATPRARRASRGEHVDTAGVAISHPQKVLYPGDGITKLDVARYYADIGPLLLPHVTGRPLTLLRCPGGWEKGCFYQKHVKEHLDEAITPVEVAEGRGAATYMMAQSVEALVALAQMGVLELHPWGSTSAHLDRPDRLVFDFDPDEDLGWPRIVEAVGLLRTLLDNLGLEGFLKTTGGKGLHVVVPIEPTLSWNDAKGFAKALSELLVHAFPDRFTAKLAKARRGGKIFIDYLRNGEGATAIAPYSVRAKRHAPVATPIAWDELGTDVRHAHFDIVSVRERLKGRFRDPWKRLPEVRQVVDRALMARVGVEGGHRT